MSLQKEWNGNDMGKPSNIQKMAGKDNIPNTPLAPTFKDGLSELPATGTTLPKMSTFGKDKLEGM